MRLWVPEGAVHPRAEIVDDRCLLATKVVSAFPLSDPHHFVSLLDEDDEEAGVLKSLDGLDEQSKSIILEQLDRRYFSPVISKIDSLKLDAGMWLFDVQTQRGPSTFYVRGWRDSAYEVSRNRWQINSVDGQRFDILDYDALEERSKNLLDRVF